MRINVLIAPERLDAILRSGLSLYKESALGLGPRGALTAAALLCDALAEEFVAQNRRGRRVPSKAVREIEAAFRRAGDEIMRMRERVEVPR